jgi:hypothetical protein
MAAFNFPLRLYGGATRPDAITGLKTPFSQALVAMYNAAPPDVQRQIGLTSAYRSPEVQRRLWLASDRTGHSVAAPGHSMHNQGLAADLYGFGLKGGPQVDQATKDWVHQNAAKFGLTFPMSYEPWHIQPMKGATMATPDPNATASISPTATALYQPHFRQPTAAQAAPPQPDPANMTSPSAAPGASAAAPMPVSDTPPPASVTNAVAGQPPAPPDSPMVAAGKKLGGVLGELQKNAGGGTPMTVPEWRGGGATTQGPTLSEIIQQYLAGQMRGPAGAGQVITPPQGGPRLG